MLQIFDHKARATIQTGSEPCLQQQSGIAFKPAQRVVHVLVVAAVKQRELLLAMRRIIRAIQIQNQFLGLSSASKSVLAKPVQTDFAQTRNAGPIDVILESRYCRLRSQHIRSFTRDRLKRRIVFQSICIVGIFVSRDDLIRPLTDQRQHVVLDVALIPFVCDPRCNIRRQSQLMIELPNQHQSRVGGDRSTVEINPKFWLESKCELTDNFLGHRHSPSQIHSRFDNANVAWTYEQTMAFSRPNL